MTFREAATTILNEVGAALSEMGSTEVGKLCELLASSPRAFVTGEGRSGLVARCFAMRLMHLGLPVHVVGETTSPRLEAGDVLVAVSGSGETLKTCTTARLAAMAGGTVVAVTAAAQSALASSSSLIVLIPAGGSDQYGGSLFEQSALIALDATALVLRQRLEVSDESMHGRHANL